MADAKTAGFKPVGDPKHPTRFKCPDCYTEQWNRAAKGAEKRKTKVNKEMVARAAKKAICFNHPNGRKMAACHCCGYRKLVIPDGQDTTTQEPRTIDENTVPTNPVTAAAKGMVMGAKSIKCKATTQAGAPCPNKAKQDGLCGVHLKAASNPRNQAPANPGF
jgi:hypothetical protein